MARLLVAERNHSRRDAGDIRVYEGEIMKMRRWTLTLLVFSTVGAVGCGLTGGYNLPPAAQIAHPGPGVGGPGPGVLTPPMPPYAGAGGVAGATVEGDVMYDGPVATNAVQADGVVSASFQGGLFHHGGVHHGGVIYDGSVSSDGTCLDGAGGMVSQEVQVLFGRPEGMQVQWDVTGSGHFDSSPLVTPGRQNFDQGGVYRLKLTNIPGAGREGVELYPTLEIGPPTYRTLAYLAHNAIPIQFNEEDFDQALAGNFVTKVIYLPDPEFQGLAVADVATLVSTRLDPGLDPIEEASRKGAILAVIRLGNKDMEVPGGDYVVSSVAQASFLGHVHGASASGCPDGHCQIGGYPPATMDYLPPGGMPADLIAGVNAPQYGMPISGTPIGLPGPPHVPLGVPAGLQRHVVKNHTKMRIPDPVGNVKINVKQRPGQSYPHPVSRAWITEDTIHPNVHYGYHRFGSPSAGQVQHVCGPNCMH
jgi:hypothetical protein